jgi:hypothetical protein
MRYETYTPERTIEIQAKIERLQYKWFQYRYGGHANFVDYGRTNGATPKMVQVESYLKDVGTLVTTIYARDQRKVRHVFIKDR